MEYKRIRNIYLHVKSGGRVVISAPLGFTKEQVEAFAREKSAWIEESLRELAKREAQREEGFLTKDRIRLWGESLPLVFLPDNAYSLTLREDKAYLTGPVSDPWEVRERFLKQQLKLRLHRAIAMRLPYWEKQTGLYARAFSIRDMKSRWGSCNTQTGRLTFHLQLISMPAECLDYLLVHELTHLRHADHSPAFWADVKRFVPDCDAIRKRMKG